MAHKILVINPGSTSTKIACYEDEREVFALDISHPADQLSQFSRILDQLDFRTSVLLETLKQKNIPSLSGFAAIVARGGLIYPVKAGVYAVNNRMVADLKAAVQGEHASNLGGLMANALSLQYGIPAFIVDPVVVDEVDDICKITGLKEIRRIVISHALSQLASAKRYAAENGTTYAALNLIVAHLGGGISVGAHYKGRYVDVNDALTGEGPFSPERSGSLPQGALIDLCFSGKFTHDQMKKKIKGQGGLFALLGTTDFRDVERRVQANDAEAACVAEAMAYQIAKQICSLLPAFKGEPVDRIILTGGLSHSRWLVDKITGLVRGVEAGVTVYAGQNEMRALGLGTLRVLLGREEVKIYEGR